MTKKSFSWIENFQFNKQFMIANNRIDAGSRDYGTMCAAVTLLVSLSFDSVEELSPIDQVRTNTSRLRMLVRKYSQDKVEMEDYLIISGQLLDSIMQLAARHAFNRRAAINAVKSHVSKSWLYQVATYPILVSGKDTDDARLFGSIYQLLNFLKKLDLDRPDIETEMYDKFIEFESTLASSTRQAEPEYIRLTTEMRSLLMEHYDFRESDIMPRHGKGAVANQSVKCVASKDADYCSDRRISQLLRYGGLGSQEEWHPFIKDSNSSRTSRYICVPKAWNKLRGISAEPTELIYWQEGVAHAVDAMFRRDPWWRQRIDLHDQRTSGKLAWVGSLTGSYATIDSTAASDSVTTDLCRRVFGNTRLAQWFIGTRSTHSVLPDGTTVRLNKFAPMGNACCFVCESIVFLLIAELAVRHSLERDRTLFSEQTLSYVCPRIYGDDVIVPYYAYNETLKLLETAGFTVNSEKSYGTGKFREACGMHAYGGRDVTPVRLRSLQSWSASEVPIQEIGTVSELSNELFIRGYTLTRRTLLNCYLKKVVKMKSRRIPASQSFFFGEYPDQGATWSLAPTNYRITALYKSYRNRSSCNATRTAVPRVHGYRVLISKLREPDQVHGHELEVFEQCEYTRKLIACTVNMRMLTGANPYERQPLGSITVPQLAWRPSARVNNTGSSPLQMQIELIAEQQL